ncbi:hypothetical protein ABIA85_008858 [Bradyrhizobium sp. LA6.10]|jgi:hypothetical protein|uniref:hypothetical protein n=1 Tax=Bradyrhizobium sp. LA6.10 TaxID=3156318 RepID=UPI00339B260C
MAAPVYDRARANAHPAFGLHFRRYAPFSTFGFGFEGDNRGPSTSLKATSRTYGCVMFNKVEVFYWFGGTSGTHRSTLLFGEIIGHSKVRMSVTTIPSTRAGQVIFKASTAGNMPLLPKTPDIDTSVYLAIEFGSQTMHVEGSVFGDTFPNLEVFLHSYRSEHAALLLDGRTTGGKNLGPISRLPGAGASIFLGKFDRNFSLNEKGELAQNYTTFATTLPTL